MHFWIILEIENIITQIKLIFQKYYKYIQNVAIWKYYCQIDTVP